MLYISAGHHKGAQGAQWNGYTEWKEAVLWRDAIVAAIGPEKAMAVPDGTLRAKVAFINAGSPRAAIEIHFNSAIVDGEHVGAGAECLYYPGSLAGGLLATALQDELVRLFRPDRGTKAGWHRQDRPGVVDYQGDVDGDEVLIYFLRKTSCPAVVLEPEFIHHIEKIRRHRDAACQAIAGAMISTFD
jgi:hypothetical protein